MSKSSGEVQIFTCSDGIHRGSDDVRRGIASGDTFVDMPVKYSSINGKAIFEGDILLGSVEEMERIRETAVLESLPTEGVGISGGWRRWLRGVIPFVIDHPDRNLVLNAIAHWEQQTAIRFLELNPDEHDWMNWIVFEQDDGCYSSVGKQFTGGQTVSLGLGCLLGAAIHEIGHAVGLWHEQSREDRDNFVQIQWANILEDKESNFEQHISDGDDIGTYDFGSIMHYGADFFGKPDPATGNRMTTIVVPSGQAIGQRNGLSGGDLEAVKSMYGAVGWRYRDLSVAAGGPAAAGNPVGYISRWGQHVVYRSNDGHIHQLWFPGPNWIHADLSAATGAPGAAGDPVGFTFSDISQQVLYRGNDGHIHCLWFLYRPKGSARWLHYDLATVVGGPNAASDPTGFSLGDDSQHVFYRGGDGHIHEVYLPEPNLYDIQIS